MNLEVTDLSKRFFDTRRGEFLAVDNVSFSCQEGEILGLLGPNGAGKTTTLKMIATILPMTAGKISVAGFDAATEPERVRRHLGFVSSDTGLYERFTPREILLLFGQLSHLPEDNLKARVDELIAMLDFEPYANVRCGKLSSGTRQKVSIARAVVHDPQVICFDEPTNGLDVLSTLALHDFIARCKRDGKCVLLSTHHMGEAEKLCDRIGIIHGGKLMALDTLEELKRSTGKHYLEDIFVKVVQEKVSGSI